MRRLSILLLVGLYCALACRPAPHDLVTAVPLGSKLSELNRYLSRSGGSVGEVTGRLSGSDHPRLQAQPYDAWKATAKERDRFSGKILFFDYGTTSSDVNELTYRDGKLVHKDWGFLPG